MDLTYFGFVRMRPDFIVRVKFRRTLIREKKQFSLTVIEYAKKCGYC